MDVAKLEITVGTEVVFGLYSEGNMLVKNDPSVLATAREQLTAGVESLSAFLELPPSVGQEVS